MGQHVIDESRKESQDQEIENETISIELIVNGRHQKWNKKKISYQEVVDLIPGQEPKDPNVLYTITYLDGPKENPSGTLAKGHSVFVKNKMIFNATPTIKS